MIEEAIAPGDQISTSNAPLPERGTSVQPRRRRVITVWLVRCSEFGTSRQVASHRRREPGWGRSLVEATLRDTLLTQQNPVSAERRRRQLGRFGFSLGWVVQRMVSSWSGVALDDNRKHYLASSSASCSATIFLERESRNESSSYVGIRLRLDLISVGEADYNESAV